MVPDDGEVAVVLDVEESGDIKIEKMKMPDNKEFHTKELAETYVFEAVAQCGTDEEKKIVESYINAEAIGTHCYYNDWRDNIDLSNIVAQKEEVVKRERLKRRQRFEARRKGSHTGYESWRKTKTDKMRTLVLKEGKPVQVLTQSIDEPVPQKDKWSTEILPWLPEWQEFLRLIALPESD